ASQVRQQARAEVLVFAGKWRLAVTAGDAEPQHTGIHRGDVGAEDVVDVIQPTVIAVITAVFPFAGGHHVVDGEHGVHRHVGKRRIALQVAEVLDRPPPFQLPGHQHETYVLDPRNAQDQDDIIGVEQQPQLFQRSGELPGVQSTIMDVADNTVIVVQRDDRTGGCNLCCCIYCYHLFTTS